MTGSHSLLRGIQPEAGRSFIFLRPHTARQAATATRLIVTEHWLSARRERLRQ
jgi:hypothetical protein